MMVTGQVQTAQRDAVNVDVAVSKAGAMIDHLIHCLTILTQVALERRRPLSSLTGSLS